MSVSPCYRDYAHYRFYQRIASSCITVFSTQQMLQAGAYTRPLFSSTRAFPDITYTLYNPLYPLIPPTTPLNTTPKCTPCSTESAYVEPKSGRL